ncbi:hypothetical protein [Hyalangium gracile]|uniref:hypothetical protein n=1 Tax=Hyalangium gracile TaxID=394092 RepID=UPI001CCD4C05|nr:hypothetical protein [Hyalangium gracile]
MAAFDTSAVRRGGEVRCPACLRFKSPVGACPSCGCGEVPVERHGAARMLLRAGVDRFALAQRVAQLEPSQAELFERQYAEQWALVQPLLEDVRLCAASLLQEGFVEEEEERLAERLPTDPERLAAEVRSVKRPPTLEELLENSASWHVQQLAAIALLRQGSSAPGVLYSVHSALQEEGRTGLEAMLALTRWRNWRWARLNREGWTRVRELARKALAQPELAPRAAVAWVRASGGAEPEVDVLFALRSGLGHADPEVRFECALCLKDEAGLMAALESTDAEQVSAARRALALQGSSRLFRRLVLERGKDFALDVVSTLQRPVSFEALKAVLAASEQSPGRLPEAILRLIEVEPFAESSAAARDLWCTWAHAVMHELPGEAALRILHWAAQPPVERQAARVFVEATAQALTRASADERARLLDDAYCSRFLALAGSEQEPLLNQWAREAGSGLPLARTLMTLTSRIRDWEEPKGQAARLLLAVWEGPGRETLLEPLGKAVREWSAISGREELIDAVWQRFQQHPDERADLLSVFAPWHQELWERQLASPEDPVARFEAWWRVSPDGFARQADLLMRDVPAKELPRYARSVFSAAEEVVAKQPLIASLGAFYAAAALANAFRAGEDGLAPQVKWFLEWLPGFEQRVKTTPPEDDRRAPMRPFLEELHTEARLIRERLDRMQEEEDWKWQQEMQRRVEESRRKDLERQAREAERQAEEARRAAEEAQRVMEAQRAAAAAERGFSAVSGTSETGGRPGALRPRIAAKPIDDEVLFPGKPLPTLLDYVRLLKAMGMGDPMKAMASAGLDIATWPAVAHAWGQAMVGRMELGMRFGELLAAPWE